ncbi:MAG: DUF2752 domain-containing protein [Winogradskyella sp.]|uniref:DUF2752 domain-containing protein n=1 Tax=Winogradskyella sp. TaxID=1883156 RepID=UPI00179D59D1|nr:DUF2752 domain-containing protein [Winogradskyella sp.]MBT8244180.1 DUF2752 domain-containing protein [Winogradskyella sp.]NNK23183.1 DUF2752 domain-containing protein [Winogradskyella sp.]
MKLLLFQLEDYMLPCVNKTLFGFECMGCGMQRSVNLLIQGEFLAAFFMYPGIYPLILLLATIGINIFKKIKYFNKIITILAVVTVITIIVSFIIKTLIN